jgi:outer membrane protein assembly factor BamB
MECLRVNSDRMISSFNRRLLVCVAALFALSVARAGDWPRWRGPDGNGHTRPGEAVPEKLPDAPKTVWRLKVGEGLASPITGNGRVFLFDAAHGKETLRALEAATGKEIWNATIDDAFADTQGPAGPRCTPLLDGGRVYAVSCKGELQCRNATDGTLVWRTNYTNDFGAVFFGEKGSATGATRHGNNASPMIDGDRLYAQVGGSNGASVVCFDKSSGKVIWKTQNDAAGYAPPVVATLAGIRQILCFTAEGLIGLDVADGRLLWRVPMKTSFGRHVTTPVFFEDMVVVASHQVGLVGTRIVRDGAGVKAEQAWLHKELAVNFSSPVLVGRHLYGLGPNKNLICVDVPTGDLKWSKTGYFNTSPDKAHAGFIVMGKKILTLTDGGELVLFDATPDEFKEHGRVQVCGLNWCNPAYADGRLYLRDGIKTTGEMFCVELTGK